VCSTASRGSATSPASDPGDIELVMHGTTVATNAVLTGRGARVGLVTTAGFEDTLQVARSFCPGGLGGWVSYIKSPLLAPLELTIGATERIGADGEIVTPLDEEALRRELRPCASGGEVAALTICLINSYINDEHERRVAEIAAEIFADTPISVSATWSRKCRSTSARKPPS
jgi:N-methylhydantoinase A